jgi:protein-L-isoaspartate O-methyltransferase
MNLYGLVIFLGAFLLFQVQPLLGKALLPWFGGSAAVWLACLMFFQVALLLGYLYAHLLAQRLPPAAQCWLHLVLLLAACTLLPVLPGAAWKPHDPESPVLRIMLVLAATVGLPCLLLAATSPLVQALYAARHDDEPYRFFAVSNAGSLLGLLSYPVLVEPWLTLRQQAWLWSALFLAYALLLAVLLLRFRAVKSLRELIREAQPAALTSLDRGAPMLWLALPACASLLLLAVTNHLTQNIAPVPFLWVLPLGLYLLSFVFTFGRRVLYSRSLVMRTLAVALGAMAYALGPDFINSPLRVLIPLYAIGFFVCCLFCHGELARLRPAPALLTSYYLIISLGGALGSAFVMVVAPLLYTGYFELQVGLGGCAALALLVLRHDARSQFFRARGQPAWLVLVALVVALWGGLVWTIQESASTAAFRARNFYGTLRVVDITLPGVIWNAGSTVQSLPQGPYARKLMHGTIDHGTQFLDPARRRATTAYYVARSGVALTIREAAQRGPIRVGVVGLGAGTLAALGVRGDVFRFYEINPLVERFARAHFTYLEDTTATVQVLHGDARLVMEREAPQNYDVLAVDAFSGDAIPLHLLTLEAFREFFRQVKPGGAVVVHISNQHLNLQPVMQKAAEVLGKQARLVESKANDPLGAFHAYWVIFTDRGALFDDAEFKALARSLPPNPAFRPWTDDYSNLLQVLK